jgi:hypothetical protein
LYNIKKKKKAHDRNESAVVVSAGQWKFTKLPKFLRNVQISTTPMKQVILLCCAGCFPKLEMYSYIWSKDVRN